MRSQKPIGEILIEAGVIDQTQLQHALAIQEQWGGKIGRHMVSEGLVNEEQLIDALSFQLGVAKINFSKSRIFLEALKLVPKKICQTYQIIPVALKDEKGRKKLLLAMADPTNYKAVQEAEFSSGCAVVTVIAGESDIRRAIEYCYHPDGLRECDGLEAQQDIVEFEFSSRSADVPPVIITAEGELNGLDKRGDVALRALVDLLVEKGVIAREEFYRRLEQMKK